MRGSSSMGLAAQMSQRLLIHVLYIACRPSVWLSSSTRGNSQTSEAIGIYCTMQLMCYTENKKKKKHVLLSLDWYSSWFNKWMKCIWRPVWLVCIFILVNVTNHEHTIWLQKTFDESLVYFNLQSTPVYVNSCCHLTQSPTSVPPII